MLSIKVKHSLYREEDTQRPPGNLCYTSMCLLSLAVDRERETHRVMSSPKLLAHWHLHEVGHPLTGALGQESDDHHDASSNVSSSHTLIKEYGASR